MTTQQLVFESSDVFNIENEINKLFEKFAQSSFFELKHFEMTPNFRKNVIIGYSINVSKTLVAKVNTDLTEICTSKKIITALQIEIPSDSKGLKNPKGFFKIFSESAESGLSLLERVLQNFIDNYIPTERFGCCHRYIQCSDALQCIAPDKLHARGCYYRENLENGKIFYGKNANI